MHLESICVFYYYKLFAPTCLGLSEPLLGGGESNTRKNIHENTSVYMQFRQARICSRK